MVAEFGMAAQTAVSGEQALALLRSEAANGKPFDIVLMDWRMPDMDGLETARRIRADASLPQMPAVLMVTAYGREEVLRGAEQIGLEGVLIKPVTQSVMFNTVLGILSRPGSTRALPNALAGIAARRSPMTPCSARCEAAAFWWSTTMPLTARSPAISWRSPASRSKPPSMASTRSECLNCRISTRC